MHVVGPIYGHSTPALCAGSLPLHWWNHLAVAWQQIFKQVSEFDTMKELSRFVCVGPYVKVAWYFAGASDTNPSCLALQFTLAWQITFPKELHTNTVTISPDKSCMLQICHAPICNQLFVFHPNLPAFLAAAFIRAIIIIYLKSKRPRTADGFSRWLWLPMEKDSGWKSLYFPLVSIILDHAPNLCGARDRDPEAGKFWEAARKCLGVGKCYLIWTFSSDVYILNGKASVILQWAAIFFAKISIKVWRLVLPTEPTSKWH